MQHVSPSSGHRLVACPTVTGCKYMVILSTEPQLTHRQIVMCPWLSNHDCCQMKVVQGFIEGPLMVAHLSAPYYNLC